MYAGIKNLEELPEKILNQLESFFSNCNEEAGKDYSIGKVKCAEAIQLIKENWRTGCGGGRYESNRKN